MSTTVKIAAGVASGYLLGRTKKLRLAITVAGLIAGKKLAADPKAIANTIVANNPELGHLRGQLTEGLAGAAKELALATAASRMEAVTQSLQESTGAAREAAGDGAKKATSTTSSTANKTAGAAKETSSTAKKSSPAKKTSPAKKATAAKTSGGSSSRSRRTSARKAPATKRSSSSRAKSGSATKSTSSAKA